MQISNKKAKTITAISVFIAALFSSFILLNISECLFGTHIKYIMTAFWLVIVSIEFHITLSVAKTKQESLILFGAILTRFIYLLFSKWGFDINATNLTSDALGFWKTAEKYFSGDFSENNMFSYFICGEFYIWGKNLFCCLFFNVFLSYLSCVVFLLIINKFELKNKTKIISLSIVAFLPYSIIESAQLNREPLYSFFVIFSFYFFTDYILTSKTQSLYYSLLSLIPVLVFHIGFFSIILIYMIASIRKSYTSGRIKKPTVFFHCLCFIALIVVILNFESMEYLIGDDVDHFEYFIDKISGTIHHKSLTEAKSAYLLDIKMNSWWKFLLFSPLKLFYYIFSPLPPYWHNIKQLLSFFLDSAVHLFMLCGIFYSYKKYRKQLSETKEYSIIRHGLLIFLATSFVFALGTSNAGTAIRHRDVLMGIEALVFALCFDKIEIGSILAFKLDNRKCGAILAIILIVQVHFLIYTGAQKQEFYIDEIYSYTTSNSYHADKIINDEKMWNTWITGNDLHNFLTVQNNERFAFSKVYRNCSTDCHPPLYYWILHTVCSFNPNNFSKWSGLSINIVLFVITSLLIYFISCQTIESDKWKYIPNIMWGGSGFAVDTCMFIRMYMLLSAITVGFIYLHVKLFRHGINMRRMLFVWLTVFLGAMTHYYSIVLTFWGSILFSIYLIRNKEIKNMIIYELGVFFSICMMFLCYPFAFKQMSFASQNNIGNHVARDLFNFKMWSTQTKDLADAFFMGASYNIRISKTIWLVVILIFVVLLALKIKNNVATVKNSNHKEILWIIAVFILTFLCVSFICGTPIRIRYIFNIIPLGYILIATFMEKLFQDIPQQKILSNSVLTTVIVFAFFNAAYGTSMNLSTYLFRERAYQKSRIETYSELPLLIITERDTSAAISGNLRAFESFDKIYMSQIDDLDDGFIITDNDLKNDSFVIYITVDKYCPEGYGYDLESILTKLFEKSDAKYEFILNGQFGEFYYINR